MNPEYTEKIAGLEKTLYILTSILLLFGLFVNLTIQPVFLEEPRRAIIAMEMMENGKYFSPSFLGDTYTMKPPVFNWLIILCSYFTDDPALALRLPTVFSTIGIALLLFHIGITYISHRFAWLLSLSFVSSNGVLFYFSLLGEIDLFYALVCLLSFFSIFHFHERKKYYLLFICTYLFGAIGFLTKGFPSIVFLGLSIPAYFWYKKDIRQLISPAHLSGLLTFLLIIGSYFLIYYMNNDPGQMVKGIWSQASDRTMLNNGLLDLLRHLFIFPIETLANTFPGLILLIFMIRKDIVKMIRTNNLVTFAILILVVNIPVYWISPGTRQRYIYMLYPMLLIAVIWFYQKFGHQNTRKDKWIWILSIVTISFLTSTSLIINFIPQFQFITYLPLLSIASMVIFSILLLLCISRPRLSYSWLLMAVAIARIMFDLSFLPQRANDSLAQREKDMANEIATIIGNEDIYIYKSGKISMTTIYYLNLLREKNLIRTYSAEPGKYYISNCLHLEDTSNFQKYLDIYFDEEMYHLIKFEDFKQD